MTQRRRVSIEFERREVTLTVRHSANVAAEGQPVSDSAPAACLTCGCLDLLPLGESIAHYPGSERELTAALVRGELHLSVAGNQLWLCAQSFDAFKETRR